MGDRVSESFGSGADGASITAGGNTSATFVSTTAPVVSTARYTDGARSMLVDCSAQSKYAYWDFTSSAGVYVVMDVWLDATLSTNLYLTNLLAASTNKTQLRFISGNYLQCRDGTSPVWTSTTALTAGQWWRIVWHVSGTTQTVDIYSGNSTTATESSGSLSYTAVGGNVSRCQVGAFASSTGKMWIDYIDVDTTTARGPAVTAPTINAGTDVTIQDAHVAALDSTASGTYTSGAWSVVSGPSTSSAQFSSTSADDPNFTPAGGAGTYVLRRTLTYSGGTVSDDVTVTVTALQATDTVDTVSVSTGYTPSSGTVAAVLSDGDSATYVVTSNNPTSLDLRWKHRGILPIPSGTDMKVTLKDFQRSGGTGTADLSIYRLDNSTLVKKITGTVAPTTMADTVITFASADISGIPDAEYRAGLWYLLELTGT